MQGCVGSDVIYTERRGQSQKPEEIYQLIEELVPGGARPRPSALPDSGAGQGVLRVSCVAGQRMHHALCTRCACLC